MFVNPDSCNIILACVHQMSLINNLNILCPKEGFMEIHITYIGRLCVWMQFRSPKACQKFLKHEVKGHLFS